MGFFSDPFGKKEKIKGFEERYTALMEKVEEDRKSAKIVRELRYDPGDESPSVKKHSTLIYEKKEPVYRVDPDLLGYGIFDLKDGERCVGSIDKKTIRLEGDKPFSFASYIPEFCWTILTTGRTLYILDKNERLVAMVEPNLISKEVEHYIHIYRSGVDLRVLAIAMIHEENFQEFPRTEPPSRWDFRSLLYIISKHR